MFRRRGAHACKANIHVRRDAPTNDIHFQGSFLYKFKKYSHICPVTNRGKFHFSNTVNDCVDCPLIFPNKCTQQQKLEPNIKTPELIFQLKADQPPVVPSLLDRHLPSASNSNRIFPDLLVIIKLFSVAVFLFLSKLLGCLASVLLVFSVMCRYQDTQYRGGATKI